MLPALGFAILLKQIVEEKWMLSLFVFGWVVMSSFQLTTTTLVFIAIAISLIYVMAKFNGKTTSKTVLSATSHIYQDEEGNYEE